MNDNQRPQPALDDSRVIAALEQYLSAVEAGERPNRQAFLARHADIAAALSECLDGMDVLHRSNSASHSRSGAGSVPAGWQPEAPLGDFRIVREIGRGGMGVVYEAVQLSLGRPVALKVLPFAAALDDKQIRRFKNEAQAAAQLHHSNIVPVYAVGADRGMHFYAMQLIEGQNLAALIEELRGQQVPALPGQESTGPYAPSPRPTGVSTAETRSSFAAQLTTQRSRRVTDFYRAAARLTAQAAEALDYAHGLGIVHRDVKPANLLVDSRGNVWITDFGLAQFHADAHLTQTGDLLGTLRYMSPEQAGGQRVLLDHRTDVYSLGATLYELLTLRPLFDGTDRQTLLRQILDEEPRPPRSLEPSIPMELETIVLKAVAKVPAERYATAHELAEDLQRYLRNEPILARRATLVQRARKWLRRHPSVPTAAAVLLVLLAVGSLAAAWMIRGEQEKTRQAYEREQKRTEEAETRFKLTREAANDMIRIAQDELVNRPDLQGLRKRLLEAALTYYQKLIDQRRDDPEAPADLAKVQDDVKKILADLAVLEGASRLWMLRETAVQDDLKVSPEQWERIGGLVSQRETSLGRFFPMQSQERQQRFLELARADEAAMEEILTTGQLGRLKQIALQLQGPAAFRETEVAAALKLRDDQREQIRAIEAEMFDGPLGLRKGGPGHAFRGGPPDGRRGGPPDAGRGGPPDGPGKRFDQKRREATSKVLEKVLEPEQRKQWRELTGEVFTGALSFEHFFGPPPEDCQPPHGEH
jgi:serine/threonine protein kinase